MEPLRFLDTDVGGPPAPGWHTSSVTTACWRRSAHNNRMVYLVLVLDDVAAPFDRISDYFVLEGATAQGISCSRRRLVELFRACGLSPQAGDEICPADLLRHRIEAKVVHELWKGRTRLKVVAYRPASTLSAQSGDDADEVCARSTVQLEHQHA